MAAATKELIYAAWKLAQADVVRFMGFERETKRTMRAIRIEMGKLIRGMNTYATLVQLETRPDHVGVQLKVLQSFRNAISRIHVS